ncbi:saccharopine dehydrogenase [Marinicella pacifica]|uniref:Saccharopine dehydrogenase n=2 Tax=Marinicella pacifica TaxID=1171543 RepID=A0A917CEP8_9GAMM|nr:saccharopine dehydrogenase NADP-binding domain-containing protein [Marinicella pacifica]GGF84276.1 saccharopine dehydrogenase [Marinicella pacifica]
MTAKILVLGGYGTFGSRISRALCLKGHHVIINGRNKEKAEKLKAEILSDKADARIEVACFDVFTELYEQINHLKPSLVIHTCGSFQGQDTLIAETVIKAGVHYIDLADGRDYVQDMLKLDALAKSKHVIVITAASTVPTLSSAVLKHLQQQHDIKLFQSVKMGISPGQKTDRGLATSEAVLSYIGKPLTPWRGSDKTKYGWQETYLQKYPGIRNRLMGNCEAADLDVLPVYFDIGELQFSAGMESKLLHTGIWLSSWLVRLGVTLNLDKHAGFWLKVSRWFNFLGTEDGGMHVEINAVNNKNQSIHKTWFIIAKNNDGPQIPCVPAIVMTEKILTGEIKPGVQPCIDIVSLNEYLHELTPYAVETFEF